MIRPATKQDAEAIVTIYNHYVLNSAITFEETGVSSQEMARRMAEIDTQDLPWLVLEQSDSIVGFAYASQWKGRCAYRYCAETTVYLEPGFTGRGLGYQLYAVLLTQLREKGLHAAIGGIALPNPASIALHEKCGMSQVAHFKEVGYKFEQWIDVGYWQLLL